MDNRISPFGRPGYKQPPTLDALCDALRNKGGQYDHELRADSIYGPLRLKTEHALIGIRKRRVQHQENARLYVFRSLLRTVDQLSNQDGLKPIDKNILRAHLKDAWEETGFGGKVTPRIYQRMVLCLREEVNNRLSRYREYLENEKNRDPSASSSPKPSGLQGEQEIAKGLAILSQKTEKNARSPGSLKPLRIDQKHSQPSGLEFERVSPLHSSQVSLERQSPDPFVDWQSQRDQDQADGQWDRKSDRAEDSDFDRQTPDAGSFTTELTGKQRLEEVEHEPSSPVTMHLAPRNNASQSLPATPPNPAAGDSHHAGTKPLRFDEFLDGNALKDH